MALINNIKNAARAIAEAEAILIGAGAGMGVDSGMPDFRGNEGFWNAYPPMKQAGLSFYDLANPIWFADDPTRAWGFYGHRRNLYRETKPHEGFEKLSSWASSKVGGSFVFTSNVDGHFQKAGFDDDRIVECHGSINFDQCTAICCSEIWAASNNEITVDISTFRASNPLPQCLHCQGVARPNILMFGDFSWIESRTSNQYENMRCWLERVSDLQIVVIEIGAGTAVPTVRYQCERLAKQFGAKMVRINPRESGGNGVISIASGGLEGLNLIAAELS